MHNLMAGQLKQHARLLRERYNNNCGQDAAAALAQAEQMEAQAILLDAQADILSIEQDCMLEDVYPIIGKVARRGGKIINIEHEWMQTHVDALRKMDIDIAWEWCHDPRAGVKQGSLIRIYIGTRAEGPRVSWERDRCNWQTIKSRGNYGRNWACGGNWSTIGSKTANNLIEIAPDLAAAIQEAKKMVATKEQRIQQAEARCKAANLRVKAAAQRDNAAGHIRQAAHPAYPNQEIICLGKADRINALADSTEAEADLILARAGL